MSTKRTTFETVSLMSALGLVLLASAQCAYFTAEDDDNTSLLALVAVALNTSSSCSSTYLKTSKFRHIVSATSTSCSLSNGTTGTCCKLTFQSNKVTDDGPFCPATVGAAGGIGMFNGSTTTPGNTNTLYDMENSAADDNTNLWRAMENAGYTAITNGAGVFGNTISILDPAVGNPLGGDYCLLPTAKDTLTVTYTIPLTPQDLATSDTIDTVENVGISLDGIPITGNPPTVTSTQNQGSIPALDDCGGHHDPSGYFHWHFVAESINTIFLANAALSSSCTNMTQDTVSNGALVGFAKDGYPIYGRLDTDGSVPGDLDACNGHTKATTDYTSAVYHYHASSSTARTATNLPPCVKGASVSQNLAVN